MKYLLTLAAIFIALWLWSVPAQGSDISTEISEEDRLEALFHKFKAGELDEYVFSKKKHPIYEIDIVLLESEENLVSHNKFRWEWHRHRLEFWYEDDRLICVGFNKRHYRELISPDSRTIDEWSIVQWKELDLLFRRKLIIVMQDDIVLVPDFPDDYVNPVYTHPTREQAIEVLNSELEWWMNISPHKVDPWAVVLQGEQHVKIR